MVRRKTHYENWSVETDPFAKKNIRMLVFPCGLFPFVCLNLTGFSILNDQLFFRIPQRLR